jgi:hypothetical protein
MNKLLRLQGRPEVAVYNGARRQRFSFDVDIDAVS